MASPRPARRRGRRRRLRAARVCGSPWLGPNVAPSRPVTRLAAPDCPALHPRATPASALRKSRASPRVIPDDRRPCCRRIDPKRSFVVARRPDVRRVAVDGCSRATLASATGFEFTGSPQDYVVPCRYLPDPGRGRRSGGRSERDGRHTRCRRTGDCRRSRSRPGETLRVACRRLGRRSGGVDARSRRLERRRRRRRGARHRRTPGRQAPAGAEQPISVEVAGGLEHRIIVGAGGCGWRRRRDWRPDRDRRRQRRRL